MAFQNDGMAVDGQEIPEIKSKGIEVNTKIMILVSRFCTKTEKVIAKNTVAERNGNKKHKISMACPI